VAVPASLEFGQRVCRCGCGRLVPGGRSDRVYVDPDACKQRHHRQRRREGRPGLRPPSPTPGKLPADDLRFDVVEAKIWLARRDGIDDHEGRLGLIEVSFEDALLALSGLDGKRRSVDAIRWAKDFIENDPSSASVFA
jgi:hypothetical protein